MRDREKLCRVGFWVVLACVFAVMLVFNHLTPLVGDDYVYAFSFVDEQRIDSVWDIFPSMWAHRFYANGRVVAHFFAQLFLMLPKLVFNVVNALNAAWILFLMLCFFPGEKGGKRLFMLLTAVFMLWYFTPDFGQVYLWLDGSCNYSWALSFALMFLLPYYLSYTGRKWKGRAIFPLIALLAGAYSESGSFAVIFMAFCFSFLIWRKERRLPVMLSAGLVLALLGFAFMMSAPIETGERGVFSIGQIIYNISYIFMSMRYYQLGLYCVFAALLALSLLCRVDKERIFLALLIFVGGLASIFIFAMAKYCPARAMCPVTAYTVLASLMLASALIDAGEIKLPAMGFAVMAVIFLFEFAIGAFDIFQTYGQAQRREAAIEQTIAAGESVAVLEPYSAQTKYSGVSGPDEINDDPYYYVNVGMARYYGVDAVLGRSPDMG